MTTDQIHDMSTPPVIPPTQPGGMQMPKPRSTWPTAIGIIAIVFGALAILGGCSGLATPWLLGVMKEVVPPGQSTGMEVVEAWSGWTVISSLLVMGLATLLLIAGIGLNQRRRWAVPTCTAWAILKMLLVVGNSVFAYMMQQAQLEAMAQQMPAAPGFGPGFFAAIGVFGVVFGIVWGWALPVFLLIWLSRAKIKAEVAGWS